MEEIKSEANYASVGELPIAEKVFEKKYEFPSKDGLPEDSVLRRLVLPHQKTARLVTDADIEKVVEEAKVLHRICYESAGPYRGAYAMHHCQIEDKDPLSLFVTANYKIIINPVIKRHSGYTVTHKEGCVTYPGKEQVVVERWQKVDVEYVTIMVDPKDDNKFILSKPIEDHFTGLEARVFQHEFDHGNAKYIYSNEIEGK